VIRGGVVKDSGPMKEREESCAEERGEGREMIVVGPTFSP
jgi:hypothetical protein